MVLLTLLGLCGGCLTPRDPIPSRTDPPIGEPGAELDARPDIQADEQKSQGEQGDSLLPSSP
ncbi:MAG: hypothetical protein VKJ66_01910 [Synechococcus sp.]|nr:hypothetical protein [Synechococcus sp.]